MEEIQKASTEQINLINAPDELRYLEFKEEIFWPKNIEELQKENKQIELITTIHAFANSKNGGYIVIGVVDAEKRKENKDSTPGVTKRCLKSYSVDQVHDHIRSTTNEDIEFEIQKIEHNEKYFIIIKVFPAKHLPIVVKNKRTLYGLKGGEIYIRSLSKIETKKISSPREMEEIVDMQVDLGISKFRSRLELLSLDRNVTDDKNYQTLELSEDSLYKAINAKAHWEIDLSLAKGFRSEYVFDRVNALESKSSYRGLEVPHYNFEQLSLSQSGIIFQNKEKEETGIISRDIGIKAVKSIEEDFAEVHSIQNRWEKDAIEIKGPALGVNRTIYYVYMVFDFLKNFIAKTNYDGEVNIVLRLTGIKGRQLFIDDFESIPFTHPKMYMSSRPFEWQKIINANEFSQNIKGCSIELLIDLFKLFNWDKISEQILEGRLSKLSR